MVEGNHVDLILTLSSSLRSKQDVPRTVRKSFGNLFGSRWMLSCSFPSAPSHNVPEEAKRRQQPAWRRCTSSRHLLHLVRDSASARLTALGRCALELRSAPRAVPPLQWHAYGVGERGRQDDLRWQAEQPLLCVCRTRALRRHPRVP